MSRIFEISSILLLTTQVVCIWQSERDTITSRSKPSKLTNRLAKTQDLDGSNKPNKKYLILWLRSIFEFKLDAS